MFSSAQKTESSLRGQLPSLKGDSFSKVPLKGLIFRSSPKGTYFTSFPSRDLFSEVPLKELVFRGPPQGTCFQRSPSRSFLSQGPQTQILILRELDSSISQRLNWFRSIFSGRAPFSGVNCFSQKKHVRTILETYKLELIK